MTSPTRYVLMLTIGMGASLWAVQAQAATPLVKIEGELPSELRTLLAGVIGEAGAPPRSLAQARRRVEKAAEQGRIVMRSQGYYGAEIKARIEEFTSDGDTSVRKAPQPILVIKPGPQFTFGSVKILYDDNQPDVVDAVNKTALLAEGAPALSAEIVAAEIRAVNYLKAHGYPETKTQPRKAIVDHDSQTMALTFNFSIGDKTRFGGIETSGSAYLIKSWPEMISPFETGEVFSDTKLNKLSSRVIATGAFDSATATLNTDKTPNADGTVTRNILLNVEQGDINTVTGEIGYSTTDGSGVELSYERRNFIGYAQTLTLNAGVKTNQIRFGVDYNIPYMFRVDRALDLSSEIAKEDTDAFTGERVSGNALITQKFSERFKLGLGVGLEASRYEEDGTDVTAYLLDGLGTASYDSRNSLLDPVKGVLVEANVTPTYNFGNRDGLFTTAQISASHYKKISDSLVIAGRVKTGTIFGADLDTIPLNRRFYGGGGGSVRGFGYQTISPIDENDDVIGGRSISEASAEIRYHGDSPFGAVAFIDAGSVVPNDLPNLEDVRYGAGLGIRYYTSFAPLRADIAIPLNKRDGDNDFQIYLSIGQAF
ncbi:autotransporter secretion outer membrane protein TamA [Litorimonas taeanensis]|uniref:Autotransporter secretion outer membrane protein TamA n=1 Tax=Litorimonas taeanensis TaxID=568099 RepID=A0A420WF97_9PROT|nr:autotransporter secretion outer membrane protein TamA [Litorimonas taeanensis]